MTEVSPTKVDGEGGRAAGGDDAGGLGVDAAVTADELPEGRATWCMCRLEATRRTGCCTLTLEQDSGAQASMMAVDNSNGEVLAMVGGRDFALSQFNRATQAQRQVGSSFKPYVYTTAIEAGAKPTDIVVDGPTSFYTPNGPYTPHNYEARLQGRDDAD